MKMKLMPIVKEKHQKEVKFEGQQLPFASWLTAAGFEECSSRRLSAAIAERRSEPLSLWHVPFAG